MTLDEAIKHAEEVMFENLEKTKGRNASDPIAINCFECAKDHWQLAEWLKELKAYKEQTDGDLISRKAVLKILSENRFRYNIAKEGYNEGQVLWSENLYTDNVREEIKELPSAERTAEWIEVIDEIDSLGNKTWHHECSICGNCDSGWGDYKFCPKCGCRMKGVEE